MNETWALLSDIHANLEALEAVIREIETQGIDRVLALGDVINYGPDPLRCLERVLDIADVVLLGNHEHDALATRRDAAPREMNEVADEMLGWTRAILQGTAAWAEIARLGAEAGFPGACSQVLDGVRLVHAAPSDPIREYVWPGHRSSHLAFNDQVDLRLRRHLDSLEQTHALNGHTHVPAILVDYESRQIFKRATRWNRAMTFLGPKTIFFVPEGEQEISGLENVRALINPGSVGQPRDRDPRASYALYDGSSVRFRRVSYDVEATQAKLRALPIGAEIRDFLAERLARGA